MNIGQKIKYARLKKGYTQEELGQKIGVQKSAVAKYESGRVVNIKRSTLVKLSQILGIPPVELVTDINEKPVETANKLADIFLDTKLMQMIEEYQQLEESKKEQVREYVHLLSGRV